MASFLEKLIWTALAFIEGGASSWTTLSGTTEEFSDTLDLETDGYGGAEIYPEADFDATPTDDVIVRVYGHNGTKRDDSPFASLTLSKATDPNQRSIPVSNRSAVVVSFQQTGVTDSHNVRASHKRWRKQIDEL